MVVERQWPGDGPTQLVRGGRFCAGGNDADPGDRPCPGMCAQGRRLVEWRKALTWARDRRSGIPIESSRRSRHRPDAADERDSDPRHADAAGRQTKAGVRSRDRVFSRYSVRGSFAGLSLPLQIRDHRRKRRPLRRMPQRDSGRGLHRRDCLACPR